MNFDFGNILTRTLQITWKHKVFLGIFAFVLFSSFTVLLTFILFFILVADNPSIKLNNILIITLVGLLVLLALIAVVLRILGHSAITLGIIRVEQFETPLKFIDLFSDSWQYFWRQLGVYLIIQLAVGLFFTVFIAFVFASAIMTMGLASICFQPIFILITPLSFLIIGVLEAAQTSVIVENVGAKDAVKRGFSVVREHVWKYLIIIMIVYLGTSIFSSILAMPFSIPFMGIAFLAEFDVNLNNTIILISIGLMLCIFLTMILVSVISQAIMKTSLTLTYLRLTQKDENQVIVSAE